MAVSIKKCIFAADVALREKSRDSIFSDKLRFIYLSLPFFDKREEECKTGFEKWIYVLKYMEVLERMDLCIEVYGSIGKITFYGAEEDIRSSC